MATDMITVVEYAKGLANEDIRKAPIVMFAEYSDVLQRLPIQGLAGSVYVGYRQAVLPTLSFRGINETSTTGHGTLTPYQEATYIMDHDIDVDRAIVDRHGMSRRDYENKLGLTAAARLWVDSFFRGDQSSDPRVFNGLQVRAGRFSRTRHNSTASGGAALSLANLDQALNQTRKEGKSTVIIAPYDSIPLWIAAARTTTLTGFVMQTWDETGAPKMSYAGHDFLWGYPKDDHAPVLGFTEVASGGGAAVTASLYIATFGEGYLHGIQIQPLAYEDVGLLQDRITYRSHIKWDVGLVDDHKYCLTRLDSWTNAAIVA